jgi:redox-sensitive bicupin YhaK (pirin superfamily)
MTQRIITSRRRDLGGFAVGRILPSEGGRRVGPFIFLDHIGPARFEPGGGIDVRPHPHIGLSTLTYLFEGEIHHRDSLGFSQPIRPGEVNWMTAGRGITHSERTDPALRASGQAMHGMQAWVALPNDQEEAAPAFDHIEGDAALPTYRQDGIWGRLVAGEAYGAKASVDVRSPLYYVHWELDVGAVGAPPSGYSENAIFVAKGAIEVDGHRLDAGQMVIFGKGQPTVKALEPSTVMALGGEPLGERHIWWNLVSSSRERIEQAKSDWKAGRFVLPPEDHDEFIPLPEEPPPPQQPPPPPL